MTSEHAQAVLFVFGQLTAENHTVISANTDEKADPQIFAQSDTGELAFYFVRVNAPEPSPADSERFRALAAKHQVVAYYAPVTLTPSPCIRGIRKL